jgi:hypothetical protein
MAESSRIHGVIGGAPQGAVVAIRGFWHALATTPGLAASNYDWRAILGGEWPLVARYLAPNGSLATAIACPSPGGDGCPRSITMGRNDTFHAVCAATPSACDDLELSAADVAVLALDLRLLVSHLADALQVNLAASRARSRPPDLLPIGRYAEAAGTSCSLWLALRDPRDPIDIDEVAQATVSDVAAVLLVPSAGTYSHAVARWSQGPARQIIHLDEAVGVNADGRLAALQAPARLFQKVRATLDVAVRVDDQRRAWTLPADARWHDVHMELTSDQEVRCTFRGEVRIFIPGDLGLRSTRNDKPKQAWVVLRALAVGGGRAGTGNDPQNHSRIQKQYELLAAALRHAFGMEHDPLTWDAANRVYVAGFTIRDSRPDAVRRRGA